MLREGKVGGGNFTRSERDARTVSVVGEVGKMGSSTTTTTSFFGESPGDVGPSNRSLDWAGERPM